MANPSAGLPMYWLLAVFFFGGFVLARRILHSPFGAVLRAIKGNTDRTGMTGHSVPAYKLAVFVIAALYAGLAGGLLGVLQSYMPPDAFSLDTSGQLVVQTVIGGVGTLVGTAARRRPVALAARQPPTGAACGRAVEADPGADLRRCWWWC